MFFSSLVWYIIIGVVYFIKVFGKYYEFFSIFGKEIDNKYNV